MLLEIACFNIESCLIAQNAGAHRVEFCIDYPSGGITPPENDIVSVRNQLSIPVHVMIRPRAGKFVYSDEELSEMKKSIEFCKNNKIDGVVFGILNENGEINEPACEELLAHAQPMKSVFHRVIDQCANIDASVEQLVNLGFDAVLLSGGKSNALDGKEVISSLQKKYGDKITIMPGGGIRSTNLTQLLQTGCKEFHSAAITGNFIVPSETEIKAMLEILKR
jgi:copper homeostasis protein